MQAIRKFLQPIRRFVGFLTFRWATRGGRYTIPNDPAFTPETDVWFRKAISGIDFYLEFGTGASTKLAQEAGCNVVGIESDPRWLTALRRTLPESPAVRLFHADIGIVGAWGYPVFQHPSPSRFAKWQQYTFLAEREVERLGQFPDLILIDGRFRAACALSIAALAAKQGASTKILFDDYVGRPAYRLVEKFLGQPSQILERAAIFEITDGKLVSPIDSAIVAKAHLEVQ